jgi:hypothetical protein
VEITMTPLNPPIVIPAAGGSFEFNVTLTNNDTIAHTFDAWIMAQMPDSSWFGPALGPVDLTLEASASLTRLRIQAVPGAAPPGDYWYEGRVGTYPDTILDTSGFAFTKSTTGIGDAGFAEWLCYGELFPGEVSPFAPSIPTAFSLKGAYPNPFNPSTTIGFSLPEAANVNLTVFDVSGRVVAEVVNGYRPAGYHHVSFDGSNLASGIYLYKLTAGSHKASGKMVLMK